MDVRYSFRLSERLLNDSTKKAQKHGMSLAKYIRLLLEHVNIETKIEWKTK